MRIDRRTFLAVASAGAATAFQSGHTITEAAAPHTRGAVASITTLDLGSSCGLRDSVAGFEAGLEALGVAARTIRARDCGDGAWPRGLLVVPAVCDAGSSTSNLLLRRAALGDLCLIELGFGFGDGDLCSSGRVWLDRTLGLRAGSPTGSPKVGGRPVPYVDYAWPVAVKVRDFSRVIPLEGHGWTPIAWSGDAVVGVRRRMGAGTVAVIGSPVGPHLRSEDAGATEWLGALADAAVHRTAQPYPV